MHLKKSPRSKFLCPDSCHLYILLFIVILIYAYFTYGYALICWVHLCEYLFVISLETGWNDREVNAEGLISSWTSDRESLRLKSHLCKYLRLYRTHWREGRRKRFFCAVYLHRRQSCSSVGMNEGPRIEELQEKQLGKRFESNSSPKRDI